MRRLGQALVLVLMAISAVGAGASVAIALYFHSSEQVLIDLGIALPDLVRFETIKVDDHHISRASGQVAAVSIGANVMFQSRPPPKS